MAASAEQHSRVLIVEDELLVATDLQATLEDLGYDVVGTADEGRKALRMVEELQPDLVLMDIQLRGRMDGIEAADAIRRRWQLPVVFLTSYGSAHMRGRAQAAASYGYVLKPFRPRDLNSTLLLAIAQHRSARELFTKDSWLRTVLDSLSDGIVATDREGRVRYMNPSAELLTGWETEEAVGKEIGQIYILRTMTGEMVEKCQLRRAIDSASSQSHQRFILTRKGGQARAIEDAASPIVAGEDLVGAVAIMRDITERIRQEHLEEAERDRLEDEIEKTSEALGQTRAELRALSSHLITAQEEERRRLARELHDDFGQRAAVLAMHANRALEQFRAEPQDTEPLLRIICSEVSELNEGLRGASHRLHPSVLDDLGLVAALRSLVTDFRDDGHDVSFRLPDSLPAVNANTSTALYRIAQEALRNAQKHAPGAPIHLTLGAQDNGLELVIRDAGPGFDVGTMKVGLGLGLLSMQERTRLVHGKMFVTSQPGEGTVVRVCVPLES